MLHSRDDAAISALYICPDAVLRRLELAIVTAVVTAAATWWVWGALEPLPVVQDEYSYVLQSRIFAQGRWTAPAPPVAASFQQPHVLTTPRVASKYPPGHALLLAAGARVGEPWLVVLLASSLSGALIFLLAESLAGPWTGLLAWLLWLGDPISLRFRPGYFSEVTSGLAWLAAWWLLQRWSTTKRTHDIVGLGVVIGWMAITRPLTALSFAVPVGVFVLAQVARNRLWHQLLPAMIAGSIVVGLLPLWNVRTTGHWTISPLELYRRDYLPFDKIGFGLDSTPPRLALSPVNADVYAEFAQEHRKYSVAQLPKAAAARLRALSVAEWSGWRAALIPLTLVGIAYATAQLWFAVSCAIALFIGYLFYAHWPGWTLYYLEAVPVLAFCAANGVTAGMRWLRRRQPLLPIGAPAAAVGFTLLAALTLSTLVAWRGKHVEDARYDSAFQTAVARAPFEGVVVFVRYGTDLHPHSTLVANSATLLTDRVWVVIDDPRHNSEVLRAAHGRIPLLYEEEGGKLSTYAAVIKSAFANDSSGLLTGPHEARPAIR